MRCIFDLAKVVRAIEAHHPVCVLVVDTNVLMNEPDLDSWRATIGPVLFVLSDATTQELEYVKRKTGTGEKATSGEKASNAIRSLASFLTKGKISEGIPIQGGWVIAALPPEKEKLETALKELDDTVKAFGREDTRLLLLTRECSETAGSLPARLLTHEVNLYNHAHMNGVPCELCTKFPIDGLKVETADVDWDRVMTDVQATLKDKLVHVEATLTAYKRPSAWVGEPSAVSAEGYGAMWDGDRRRPFLWTVSFYPQRDITARIWPDSPRHNPSTYLDFLGDDDFNQSLFDGVAAGLSGCAYPCLYPGEVNLQDPVCLMEHVLFATCIDDQVTYENAVEEAANYGSIADYWANMIDNLRPNEVAEQLRELIRVMDSMWKIGQTYKFSFMPHS